VSSAEPILIKAQATTDHTEQILQQHSPNLADKRHFVHNYAPMPANSLSGKLHAVLPDDKD
jgi:hypothetical protein